MAVLEETIDIAVIGAGHAGCEAALAAARMGLETVVFTVSVDSIAMMPCNPNIGGTSKGHLVKEIDALGGEMGKNIDKTFIQSKMLNKSKGPAVHSLRAQADKRAYSQSMREVLENTDHLTIRQMEIAELIVEDGVLTGVKAVSGAIYHCKAAVLCTGVYLNARCIYGDVSTYTGPNGLQAATHLTDSLKANGVELAEYDDVLTILAAQTEEQTVLADPASVNYAVYQTLQANPALTVKDEADPLLPMKGVKNEVELAHTREAHIRDGVAMVRFQIELENRLAAGEELTELTIDEILHKYRSAQDKFLTESFGTIAAYGPNAAMMHYHATEEDHAKLEKKGFLLVDSGATYMDGTTDITRTYPLGELTEDERLFYTWTLQCHIDIARAVWLDYCDGHMLDTIAREPLWRHLINYRCGTGHSVSFVGNVHEGPHALNGRNTTVFQPGMIVTDEPGVYEAGQVGIRIENELECYHKADNQYGTFLAFRPLTFVPIATSPVVPGVLNRDELDWLNAYHREVFEKLAPRLNEEERDWLAKKCAAIGA